MVGNGDDKIEKSPMQFRTLTSTSEVWDMQSFPPKGSCVARGNGNDVLVGKLHSSKASDCV